MTNKEFYSCPVCGYDQLLIPPYDETNCASFDICVSCGTQFGYDDASTSASDLRKIWIKKGMPWYSKSTSKPQKWDPTSYMKKFEESDA